MKRLFTTLLVLSSITAFGADVECAKVDGQRGLRPTNALAKGIAIKLKVKTCNGTRYNEFVAKNKLTKNYEIESKMTDAQLISKYKVK